MSELKFSMMALTPVLAEAPGGADSISSKVLIAFAGALVALVLKVIYDEVIRPRVIQNLCRIRTHKIWIGETRDYDSKVQVKFENCGWLPIRGCRAFLMTAPSSQRVITCKWDNGSDEIDVYAGEVRELILAEIGDHPRRDGISTLVRESGSKKGLFIEPNRSLSFELIVVSESMTPLRFKVDMARKENGVEIEVKRSPAFTDQN